MRRNLNMCVCVGHHLKHISFLTGWVGYILDFLSTFPSTAHDHFQKICDSDFLFENTHTHTQTLTHTIRNYRGTHFPFQTKRSQSNMRTLITLTPFFSGLSLSPPSHIGLIWAKVFQALCGFFSDEENFSQTAHFVWRMAHRVWTHIFRHCVVVCVFKWEGGWKDRPRIHTHSTHMERIIFAAPKTGT